MAFTVCVETRAIEDQETKAIADQETKAIYV